MISADGYILTLHRIPSGKNDAPGNSPKVPVFLGHCLVGSSSVFSFGPPEKSLAYMLADAGGLQHVHFLKSEDMLGCCYRVRRLDAQHPRQPLFPLPRQLALMPNLL